MHGALERAAPLAMDDTHLENVPLPAGLAGLVVLLALAADREPLVGELDLDGLGEARRGEGQDVAMGRGLGVEQLLRVELR